MNRLGLLRCAVAAVLFGASAPAVAPLARELSAPTLAGLLYLGAALAVLPALRRLPARPALRADGARLATAVVVGGAAGPVLLALGLARTSAASASLLLNLELVFTVLLAGWFFREHLGGRVVAATALVTTASVLLGGWDGGSDVRAGAVLVAAACLCWAVDNSVTATIDRLSPAAVTLAKGLIAGSVNLAVGLSLGPPPPLTDALFALGVGAVGYGLSITLWVTGARDLGAARAQVVFSAAPFVGVAVAWTLLAEPVTAPQLLAAGLLLAGIALVLPSDHRHDHAHQPAEHAHEHEHDAHHADHPHTDLPHGDHQQADHGHVPTPRRHSHPHRHEPLRHSHQHLPDLHHRHGHAGASDP